VTLCRQSVSLDAYGGQVHESWERYYVDQTNVLRVYRSKSVCQVNTFWKQCDSRGQLPGALLDAQSWGRSVGGSTLGVAF
jgi:hypothetical protein